MNGLAQIEDRLRLFCEILSNDLELGDLTERQRVDYLGQLQGIGCALSLLGQVRRNGEVWTGGYVDNVGVTHRDTVKAHREQRYGPTTGRQNAALPTQSNQPS